MRARFIIPLLAVLVFPTVASSEVQTFTATHTYILGDHDSKDDARQRCLLEAKRKVLEQAGVYIESAAEVKDYQLTKDKITSFAAAVMQVKDTKEKFGFENGHMTMMLTLKADVDLAEVKKQLALRQIDTGVRDTVAAQQERLKRLEAQIEAIQQERKVGQAPGQIPVPPPDGSSAVGLEELMTRAAQGDATAQFDLGVRYHVGDGVSQDYDKARDWLERAAAQGQPWAQFDLGIMYKNGDGVSQDYVKARGWFEKAAAQGSGWAQQFAQYNLGELYHFGYGVTQDFVKAWQWYKKAAAQGDADAQTNLGMLYQQGQGVPQDYTTARQLYEKAAAQGNSRAQTFLGALHDQGLGVPQDYEKARQWWEKAAAQRDAWAQIYLGYLYATYRHGASQDYERAYMWSYIAATSSTGSLQQTAADNRDRVAHSMTPAQLAEARRLTQQYQARQFKGC